ncbi:LOW QUALITY PROTEIN: hypothetical protein PHAVU_004G105000 [Phaseolus vulgaris]|uniref:Large ribosomal subunit protein bL20c n=1 Tax=Phaseolus vulgaris TaxID=3885 RepID=V7C5E8_PHAVU|nr:hypothetical protein PHAVU_004G105000g [Phaseolus vulgaris]ESW24126.1 hypothetical protein PHAVU_004G105000g [Phaseolus vulgaris]
MFKLQSFKAWSFRGAYSIPTRTITQQKMKALVSAHRDRDRKKRDFRGIQNLYTRQLLLNPKIVVQIIILKEIFMIANNIMKT